MKELDVDEVRDLAADVAEAERAATAEKQGDLDDLKATRVTLIADVSEARIAYDRARLQEQPDREEVKTLKDAYDSAEAAYSENQGKLRALADDLAMGRAAGSLRQLIAQRATDAQSDMDELKDPAVADSPWNLLQAART